MDKKELNKILEIHSKWLKNEVNGQMADLRHANLSYADLRCANLRCANLSDADLSYADLRCANLSDANLSDANLSDADLSYADLRCANLSDANLSDADLRRATLPSPTIVILAKWGKVSDRLCNELINFDAHNCPYGEKLFNDWLKNDTCPYNGLRIQRCANFQEKKEIFKYKKTIKTAFELMKMLIIEKCKDSDYHIKSTILDIHK